VKVAVEYRDDVSLDQQTAGSTVHGEQTLEVRRTVDGAVAAVELRGRQLLRTFYITHSHTHSVLTAIFQVNLG